MPKTIPDIVRIDLSNAVLANQPHNREFLVMLAGIHTYRLHHSRIDIQDRVHSIAYANAAHRAKQDIKTKTFFAYHGHAIPDVVVVLSIFLKDDLQSILFNLQGPEGDPWVPVQFEIVVDQQTLLKTYFENLRSMESAGDLTEVLCPTTDKNKQHEAFRLLINRSIVMVHVDRRIVDILH